MGWLTSVTGVLAPLFLVLSPFLSYGDQALSMHRNKSSAGFSLDIPLIMLVASFLRIFYWPGARFDTSLLVQSFFMVSMQLIILKVALDHRPPPPSKGGEAGLPFAGVSQENIFTAQRPYNFWQWRSPKPYWQFLLYLFIGLAVGELVMSPIRPIYPLYSTVVGITGLSVESILPIPQIMANARSRSCKGFRPSLLASWVLGDGMKIFWFFTSTTEIPLAFKVCGIFQAMCDAVLGAQYFMYANGVGDGADGDIKDHPMAEMGWQGGGAAPSLHNRQHPSQADGSHAPTRSLTPSRRTVPFQGEEVD